MPATTQANFKKSFADTVKGNTNISNPNVHDLRKPRRITNPIEKT